MRWYVKLFIVLGALACILFVLKSSGMLSLYTVGSPASAPALQEGKNYWVSNLKTPQRFDHIAYRATSVEFGEGMWTHRLVGLPGDTIEIKDGDLYVNHRFVDTLLSIFNEYLLEDLRIQDLKDQFPSNSYLPFLYDNMGPDAHIYGDPTIFDTVSTARRNIHPIGHPINTGNEICPFDPSWNLDHFGPLVVPEGKYFVLGDNRHASMDSRILGFVDQQDVVGVFF